LIPTEEGPAMGATRIVLSDDVQLTVAASIKQLQKDMYDAMGNGGWLLIRPDDGPQVAINPRQVLYMEELPPRQARQAAARAPRPRRQRQPA
jgi:hypothetical protein